jgi:hypothetical protein
MYRLVIEHPEYLPRRMQALYDLRAGHDKGRIYRIYAAQAKLRPIPRLDKLRTGKLAAALDSPNGWQRDTVQRLLVHKAVSSSHKAVSSSHFNILMIWSHDDLRLTKGPVPGGCRASWEMLKAEC